MSGPWSKDIDGILARMGERGIDVRVDVSADELLAAMTSAWQYGYTTGMADAAKFEDAVAKEIPRNTA